MYSVVLLSLSQILSQTPSHSNTAAQSGGSNLGCSHTPKCLFRGAVGDKFVFMDDNATCHRTLAVQDCLDSEGIQRLVCPARSPDLNPIENVWDALGRHVAVRNYPPTNQNTLIRTLTEEWDKLPQQLLDNVQSMVRRVECCITLHGGHIP
ncbi:transposable element Tcb1 transposase [Trichonephila clavipes]|nr:transposable element Tcb1 transposase [Trichonephila clavipes]